MRKFYKVIGFVFLGFLLPFSANAETRDFATITRVEPQYVQNSIRVPITQCYNVQVPIYGRTGGGASGADVLGGMIIGGLLGKGITGDDKGAAFGAITGGMISADRNRGQEVVTGYRTEQRCETTHTYETRQELRNYLITYEYKGVIGTAYTTYNYEVGQKVPVRVSIGLN